MQSVTCEQHPMNSSTWFEHFQTSIQQDLNVVYLQGKFITAIRLSLMTVA